MMSTICNGLHFRIITTAMFILIIGLSSASARSLHTDYSTSWSRAVESAQSPKDIAKAVKDRVSYSRDMFAEDEWRSGEDTWAREEGDCEDFAAAVMALCEESGFKAEIYVVRSKSYSKSHAVAIGEWNSRVWVSSNGSYADYQSMRDAKAGLARGLGWYAPAMEMQKVERSLPGSGRAVRYANTAINI